MDSQIRELQRRVSTGDIEAAATLAALYQRSGSLFKKPFILVTVPITIAAGGVKTAKINVPGTLEIDYIDIVAVGPFQLQITDSLNGNWFNKPCPKPIISNWRPKNLVVERGELTLEFIDASLASNLVTLGFVGTLITTTAS